MAFIWPPAKNSSAGKHGNAVRYGDFLGTENYVPPPRIDTKVILSGPGFSGVADIFPDELNRKHEESGVEYAEKFQASEGFDVDEVKGGYVGLAIPIDLKARPMALETVTKLSKMAIDMYNADYGTNYKFTNVVKANDVLIAGFRYYITFEALDVAKDAVVTTFQTRAYQLVPNKTLRDGLKVDFCRVKST